MEIKTCNFCGLQSAYGEGSAYSVKIRQCCIAGNEFDLKRATGMNTPESLPIKNNLPAVWDLVMDDIKERDKMGEKKYNTRLQPFNGRNALIDAYQEALDLVVYLRQAIYERDSHNCLKPDSIPCMICGKPATKFTQERIELPYDPDDEYKKFVPGLKTAYCDEHYEENK